MAGATAATAAGVTTVQAGFVTINLTGNFISATGGNHLNADLTGDGQPDLTIANALYTVFPVGPPSFGISQFSARVDLNGVPARVFFTNSSDVGVAYLDQQSLHFDFFSPNHLTGSIPITFTDLHINNGRPTKGLLDVTVSGFNPQATIRLDSLTFHTPDNGSTLALLAMGATGVLAFRRSRATPKH